MNKIKQDLKNCPFCGHKARQYTYQTEYGTQRFAIQCTNCGAEIDTLSKSVATRLWNKRVDNE